jgi:hypothetical protein
MAIFSICYPGSDDRLNAASSWNQSNETANFGEVRAARGPYFQTDTVYIKSIDRDRVIATPPLGRSRLQIQSVCVELLGGTTPS